jgi:branched-chain amino acid transport system ATP-binding protein
LRREVHERVFTTVDGMLLRVDKIHKQFDGLLAVNRVSFDLGETGIVALIGPNGAGKTTILNLISGVCSPTGGEVLLRGERTTGMKPFEVAARGITRTFQSAQIFREMTVLENVLLGLHCRTRSGFVSGMLHPPGERREEEDATERAMEALEQFGIDHLAGRSAGTITLREQRCLEIARSVVSGPHLLLLDEPAAGLSTGETEEMGRLITGLKEQGLAILLVEHDMNLVMTIADRMIVLHHGMKIAEGTPTEVQRDPEVIKAYLGNSEPVAPGR